MYILASLAFLQEHPSSNSISLFYPEFGYWAICFIYVEGNLFTICFLCHLAIYHSWLGYFIFLYPFAFHTFQNNPSMSVKLHDIQYSKTKALKVIHTNKNSIRFPFINGSFFNSIIGFYIKMNFHLFPLLLKLTIKIIPSTIKWCLYQYK